MLFHYCEPSPVSEDLRSEPVLFRMGNAALRVETSRCSPPSAAEPPRGGVLRHSSKDMIQFFSPVIGPFGSGLQAGKRFPQPDSPGGGGIGCEALNQIVRASLRIGKCAAGVSALHG